MDQLNAMQTFVAVVEEVGFTAAANKTGMSRAQISKSVKQLEGYLETRLLNRTTRQVSLTETGQIYYERCKAVLSDIDEMDAIASEQTIKPFGTLSLSAPNSFGILHLDKVIPEYLKRYPDVSISINLTDRLIDVVSEGFDVVLRISAMEDSSLIARRIAPCQFVFCASPDYLQRAGRPVVPQDLRHHACLIYTNTTSPNTWVLEGPQGSESVKVTGPMNSDNGNILRAASVAGLGICLLPTFIAGPDLQAGRLQRVLLDYSPEEISIHAVFPSRRYLSAKVRTFVDYISEYFGENPVWDKNL